MVNYGVSGNPYTKTLNTVLADPYSVACILADSHRCVLGDCIGATDDRAEVGAWHSTMLLGIVSVA